MDRLVLGRSYWLDQALGAEADWRTSSPPLSGSVRVDVCIVGGGFTGLWTAVELLQREPGLRIAVLEANVCGAGASGANAGYLMNLWPKFSALSSLIGRDDAARVAQHSSDCVSEIIEFVEAERIQADLQRGGWVWASTNPSQDGTWLSLLEQLDHIDGSPFRVLDASEAQQLSGSEVREGLLDPTCAVLQPARLVRGLRRWLLDAGVSIYENTRMTGVCSGSEVRVTTDLGQVRADAAILAVNAWAMAFPQVRPHMLITASDNVVMPLPPSVSELIRPGVGTSDSGRLLNYWRTTGEGHLLFGKGGLAVGYGSAGADRLFGPDVNDRVLGDRLRQLLPRVPYRPMARWRAPVEYSVTSLPFFAPLETLPRVFLAAGYSGDGLGPSRLGAKVLASQALGTDDEWSQHPLTRMPTQRLPREPVRFLGGQLVGAALLHQDTRQAAGRSTGTAAELLTRLDLTSWVS